MVDTAENDRDRTITQRYGVLTTGLDEALAAARSVLEPHAELLAEGRMAELGELLAEFARRRVRVAIYGEVKSGKSTLVNALSGAELSPVAFDPLTSIPVRITYGSQTVWRVGGGTVESLDALARIMRTDSDTSEVAVETNLDLLQLGGQVDLLDTPGVGSEERFDSISAALLKSLDAVVLVVRYPALFTQLTRTLIKGLESDIGKLFVVWNLDAACADLAPEERSRHAETLRANVVGAHELCLVDARAGFRAAVSGDSAGVEASGLAEFSAALGRFASSDKRQVVALREAAKRADRWLGEAEHGLSERKVSLDGLLRDARARLRSVQEVAEAKEDEVRASFAGFRNALGEIADQRAGAAVDGGQALRKQLRAARWRWVQTGNFDALASEVTAETSSYADGVDAALRRTVEELQAVAKHFGAVVSPSARQRYVPSVESLGPDDRKQRATDGRGQLLRRAIWSLWYLPGFAELEREEIQTDLGSQAVWFDKTVRDVEEAGRAVLDERLGEIRRQAEAETGEIKAEVSFEACEAEHEAIISHLPTLAEQRERVARINQEARELMA